MEASVVDLRYKMKAILKALFRNEVVKIFYHGKEAGQIIPVNQGRSLDVTTLPFFGMCKDILEPVSDTMSRLRKGRYRDL